MEFKIKILVMAMLLFVSKNIHSDSILIKKAYFHNKKLRIIYYNNSNISLYVPILSLRHGVDEKWLSQKYFSKNKDTLLINVSRKYDGVIKVKSAEYSPKHNSPVVYFFDKLIKPGGKYQTSIKIEVNNIKYIILQYDNVTMQYALNK